MTNVTHGTLDNGARPCYNGSMNPNRTEARAAEQARIERDTQAMADEIPIAQMHEAAETATAEWRAHPSPEAAKLAETIERQISRHPEASPMEAYGAATRADEWAETGQPAE